MTEKLNVSLLLRPRTLTALHRDGSRSSNDKVRPERPLGERVPQPPPSSTPCSRKFHEGRAALHGHTSLAISWVLLSGLENVCDNRWSLTEHEPLHVASHNTATYSTSLCKHNKANISFPYWHITRGN